MLKIIIILFILNFLIIFLNLNLLINFIRNILILILLFYLITINYNNYWINLYNYLGVDNISNILIILRFWIIILIFFISKFIKNKLLYSFLLLILLIFLLLRFISINYFLFYLFFEISLIPTFLLIIGWGYQPERINASIFILLYTIFASLPLLILIFYLYNFYNSLNYILILNNLFILNNIINFLFYIFILLAFIVKLPIFIFHIWLPKAHVEAPVTGRIILAGVILKLGGYGVVRSTLIIINFSLKYNYYFIIISLIGLFILSLVCLRQYDIKLLVAYSSVVHIAVILIGLITLTLYGIIGGMFLIVGHGLCSSALFILVNLLYDRSKSRNIIINKGIIYYLPTLSIWWFLFCVGNISAPITLNLLSELIIINTLINWSINIIIIFFFGLFFRAIYSLYLYSYCQHGKFNEFLIKININNINEYYVLILHWIPLNFLIFKIDLFIYLNNLIKILICGIIYV